MVASAALPRRCSCTSITRTSTDAAFGHMVEARSLRVALNARMHALPALQVFAPANAEVERQDADARVTVVGGPTIDLPARGGRGGTQLAAAACRGHTRDLPTV